MTVREILKMGDARLLRLAEPVRAFDTPELHGLIADMRETMAAVQGAGLAAPQIGVNLQLVVFGSGLAIALAALVWLTRGDAPQAVLAGIALAMSLLPQEFAVIMIVFFALAARRLATHHVLTRRLHAIESLGETTVLCVDKTGTLTENRMQVAALSAPGQRWMRTDSATQILTASCRDLLDYAVLASETAPHDPMERAFHELASAQTSRTPADREHWMLAREYELSPELLAMTHLWRSGEPHDVVAAKGAPEAVALLCRLTEAEHAQAMQEAESLASQGLRVLAVARALHPADQPWPARQHEFNFEWLGLVALAVVGGDTFVYVAHTSRAPASSSPPPMLPPSSVPTQVRDADKGRVYIVAEARLPAVPGAGSSTNTTSPNWLCA